MPDFKSCITEGHAAGEIAQDVAELAHEVYDDAFAEASKSLSPVDADRVAAQKTMERLDFEKVEAQRRRTLAIRTRRKLLEGIKGYKESRGYKNVQALGGGGGKPPKDGWHQGGEPPKDGPFDRGGAAARALQLIVENKPGLAGGPFASLEGRYRATRGQFDAAMADVIEKFESRFGFDKPGRADMVNVVRELFGQDTGHGPSKMLAQAFSETAERARVMFNAAGGHIAKLENWGLPQSHDPIRVRAAGKDAWIDQIVPELDRSKILDHTTNAPISERRLRGVLRDVYETISTEGLIDREPGANLGRGALANRRDAHRVLVFKDADAWMRYQENFGTGDPFEAMMHHLDGMAKDIARLQILGPNPEHQWQWLKSFAEREAAIETAAGAKDVDIKARGRIAQADNMMDHFTGTASTPVNPRFATSMASVRAYTTAAMLGSTIVSDMPSAPIFGALARTFSGLSGFGDVGRFAELIASPERRHMARRMGFVLENATEGFAKSTQDNLRLMSVGERVEGKTNAFARRLPAFIMRIQGMSGWDAARKYSFKMEFLGKLHDVRDQTLAQMTAGGAEDKALATLLKARGFTEDDWKQIRATPAWEPKSGAKFLRPSDVANSELGLRLSEMIETQSRLAVPQTTLWTRAAFTGKNAPGTFMGEMMRSVSMFHSFSLTTWHLYAEEIFLKALRAYPESQLGQRAYMATWAASALGVMTLAGAAAIQLRELVKGNTPRDMHKAAFWEAALSQGGGLAILGDFAYSAQNRAGKSSAMTAFGPAAAVASDAYNMTVGNAGEVGQAMIEDHKTLGEAIDKAHVGREGTDLVRRYSPISSLWWARAAWNRAVADQLQKLVDPEAERSFQARAQMMERQTGSRAWWQAGQALPSGAEPEEPQP